MPQPQRHGLSRHRAGRSASTSSSLWPSWGNRCWGCALSWRSTALSTAAASTAPAVGGAPGSAWIQAGLLRAEGIRVDAEGRLPQRRLLWIAPLEDALDG